MRKPCLQSSIGIGNPPLSTMAEFQKAFDDLADAFVSERMARLDAVDALDLPQEGKDNIKAILLTTKKVKDIDIASTTMKLEQIDGTSKGGRDFMLADLHRPNNPGYIENRQPVLAPEKNRFTVNIEGRTIRCAVSENTADNAHVADQIEALCGKVHVEQANTVMRGLSQAAHGPLLAILPQHGIANPIGSEHTPLTYTLSKNDETGAVTIRYSEPDGFPFKFHWETTVALDGTSSTTPIAIDA